MASSQQLSTVGCQSSAWEMSGSRQAELHRECCRCQAFIAQGSLRTCTSSPAEGLWEVNLHCVRCWEQVNHVQGCLLSCWKKVFAITSAFSWQNSVSLCPASFCTPRPNFLVTISWPPSFAFQSPIMKRTSFLGVSFRRSCRSS